MNQLQRKQSFYHKLFIDITVLASPFIQRKQRSLYLRAMQASVVAQRTVKGAQRINESTSRHSRALAFSSRPGACCWFRCGSFLCYAALLSVFVTLCRRSALVLVLMHAQHAYLHARLHADVVAAAVQPSKVLQSSFVLLSCSPAPLRLWFSVILRRCAPCAAQGLRAAAAAKRACGAPTV